MPPSKLKSLHGNRSYGIKRSHFRKSLKFSPNYGFFGFFIKEDFKVITHETANFDHSE